MEKLADISTFNRLATCNSTADDVRQRQLSYYKGTNIQDPRHFLGRVFGKRLVQPREAETPAGIVLLGQQQPLLYFKQRGTLNNFWEQLNQYQKESKMFCHMYANAELEGNATDKMRWLRRRLIDFDSSIRNFVDILKHNTVYRAQLE